MSRNDRIRPTRWSAIFGRELPIVLKKSEAAELLQVSPRTLNRYWAAGRLTRMKLTAATTGSVRFNLAELERFASDSEGK